MDNTGSKVLVVGFEDGWEWCAPRLRYLCLLKGYSNHRKNIIILRSTGKLVELANHHLHFSNGGEEIGYFNQITKLVDRHQGILQYGSMMLAMEQLINDLCFPYHYNHRCVDVLWSYSRCYALVSNTSQKQLLESTHFYNHHHHYHNHEFLSPSIRYEYKYLCQALLVSSHFRTDCGINYCNSLPHSLKYYSTSIQRIMCEISCSNTALCKLCANNHPTTTGIIAQQPDCISNRCCLRKISVQMGLPVKQHSVIHYHDNVTLEYRQTTTTSIGRNTAPCPPGTHTGSKIECVRQGNHCNSKLFSHRTSLNSSPSSTTRNKTCDVNKTKVLSSSFVSSSSSSPPSSSSPLSSTTSSKLSSSPTSTSCSNSMCVLLLFLLAFFSNARPTIARSPRKDVASLHAFMPSQYYLRKEYTREYSNVRINFLRDSRHKDLEAFVLWEKMTQLESDKPTEILDAFCLNVLNGKTAAILNINNPLGMRRRSASNRYILNLAQHWGIPTISWDTEYSGTPRTEIENRALQIAPTVSHQVRAMVSVLERYNWTQFSIVTSRMPGDMEFVSSLESFVDMKQSLPPRTDGVKRKRYEILSKVHIDDYKKSEKMLSRFVNSESRVFLLHCSSTASLEIIQAASTLNLLGMDYVWILSRSAIPNGSQAPKHFPVGLLGVSFDFGKEAMKAALRVGVKIWLTALLNMIRDNPNIRNMNIPPKQLECKSTEKQFWEYGRVLYEYMRNVTIRDEPHIAFNRNGTLRETEISILNLQWYQGTRLRKQWKEVGRWKRYGLKMKDITWPGESSMAPSGKPKRSFMRVHTLYETPYVIYRNLSADGECGENSLPCQVYVRDDRKNILRNGTLRKCCVGLSIDLLKILQVELNFDIELKEVKDGQWGGTDSEGNWNGLVKALMEDECDMVITSLKINPDRAGAVQFSVPYLETGIKIIVALRDGAISPTAFLEPFDILCWILTIFLSVNVMGCIVFTMEEFVRRHGVPTTAIREEPYDYASWSLILVFSVHATGSSILIFEWLSPKGLNRGLTPTRDHKFSLFRSFWLIWAMLFSTSVQTDSPRGIASRFLANIWALFALVFLASYTANLAAFMITKEEFYDLSGIKDYRLQNPYVMNPPFKYATTAFGSTEAMLKANHMKMYKYMKKLNRPDVEAGIKALKAGDIHAFIYDSSVLEYIASRDPNCRLVTVGNRYAETGYGIGFPPDSNNPWIDKVNRVILKLQENGEMDRLQKFWLAGACDTKKETGVSNRTLGILNFTSAFILLGSGILLGLLLLVIEHMYFKFGRKHLRKIDKCGCCALVSLSMGRSLRMKDTVTQAMSLVAKNRCKDPICETHMWKLKHKLDMALLKIENLEVQLSISEDDDLETMPKSVTMGSPSFYDSSQSNHKPDFSDVCQQQPQPQQQHHHPFQQSQNHQQLQHELQQYQQQQQHQLPHSSSHGLSNNIGNHNNSHTRRRNAPCSSSSSTPYSKHNPSLFEVHSIPEVTYTKDQNGDTCHIRAGIPEEEFNENPNTLSEASTRPENNLTGSKYIDFPPSYSDCSTDYFHEDDGRYAPFNVLDDIDSECGSTHSTATTSLGANMTGKISPWPGLKRSPSYTSAVGGSFGSDIDNKSPSVNRSRTFDGKTYMGVSGL